MSQDSTNAQVIANMEALLNAGVVQTSQDGTTTTFDTGMIRDRLRELKRSDQCSIINNTTRPVMFKANFSRI